MEIIKGNLIIDDAIKRLMKNNNMEYIPDTKIANIEYNEKINNNYQYKVIRSIVCDGTLSFFQDLILRIMDDLINQRTYFKLTLPKEKINKLQDINYTIGDFKLIDEFGDYGIKDKPWLHSRFTVELPIACNYVFKN